MSRLRIPGLARPQVDLVSVAARPRTQLHSRLSFRPRVPACANPSPTARSFVPSLTSQVKDSVRSLPEPRQGSRLTSRSSSPTERPSFLRHSIVEERRAAREARPRPWDPKRSTSPTLSRLSRLPTRNPQPTIPEPKRSIARSRYVRAKPEASARGGRKTNPGKSVRFEEEVTVVPVTRWINDPVKRVQFGDATVIPPAPWVNNTAPKSVSFGCRKTVVPVTRWIDQEKHVSVPSPYRKRPSQAPTTAQVAKPVRRRITSREPTKPAKSVHFGEDSVASVSRWIIPRLDVHPEPAAIQGRRIQGWSVTPLSKPDKDGLEVRYTTSWKSSSYVMLPKHSSKPCDHGIDCSYNHLAQIQAKHPEWAPKVVFQAWLHKRDHLRRDGYYVA
ncbi:hypothetical protein BJX99DRAFT_258335 [Aspergillus californicus]